MNEENVEGADVADEAAEEAGKLMGELFTGITDVMRSQEAIREVQSVLILRLAEAVIDLQMSAGKLAEALKLGEAFGMAAAVLNANKQSNSEESK